MLKYTPSESILYDVKLLSALEYPFNTLTAQDVEQGVLTGEFEVETDRYVLDPFTDCFVIHKATGRAVGEVQYKGLQANECSTSANETGWKLNAPKKFLAIWVHGGQVDCIETIRIEAHSLKGALIALCAMKSKEIEFDEWYEPLTQGSSLEECIAFFQYYGFLERVLDENMDEVFSK